VSKRPPAWCNALLPPGDRACGIRTLPVTLGPKPALACAAAAAAAGAAAGAAAAALAAAPARAAAALVAAAAAARLGALAARVWRSGLDRGVLAGAVEECKAPIGVGVILLAALGGT
jgi:4-hydroxybenzoate polyprenyltransferase